MGIETEMKIKEAAKKVFRSKGFAATRTRDIAEEAQINLALLNYYFKSKQQLFNIIMMEDLEDIFQVIINNANDKSLSLREKLLSLAEKYADVIAEKPELPNFILSEVHGNHEFLLDHFGIKESLSKSDMMAQFFGLGFSQEEIANIVVNLLGYIIFPYISRPMYTVIFNMDEDAFSRFINNRRKQIPEWIDSLLQKK